MANQITGIIQSIGPTLNIASKDNSRTFLRREVILDASRYDQYTGEKLENHIQLEFGGNKCQMLDEFKPGQLVTISFTLSGRNYRKADGSTANFTRVQGYAIEERRSQAPQPVPTLDAQPQNVAPLQPTTAAPTTPTAAMESNSSDDLPF